MAMYSDGFVDVMMDSGGEAYPNEKVACYHGQYYSTQVATTRDTIATFQDSYCLE